MKIPFEAVLHFSCEPVVEKSLRSIPFYLNHGTFPPFCWRHIRRLRGHAPSSLLVFGQVPPSARYDDQARSNRGIICGTHHPWLETRLVPKRFPIGPTPAIFTSALVQGRLYAELTAKSDFFITSCMPWQLKPFYSSLFCLTSVPGVPTRSMSATTNYIGPMTVAIVTFSTMASSSRGGV